MNGDKKMLTALLMVLSLLFGGGSGVVLVKGSVLERIARVEAQMGALDKKVDLLYDIMKRMEEKYDTANR